jgi:death-on-curing protein
MIYPDLEVFIGQLNRIGLHVRDVGLLSSALERPQTTLFGEDAYPTFELKAAAMVESIIRNHALIDGNKRSSWFALNYFAMLNRKVVVAEVDDAFAYILGVANKTLTLQNSADWIAEHVHDFGV